MSKFIGIDTSNYTTSVCVYDDVSGSVLHHRKLLPVSQGAIGLRQSDAVFYHTKQLPDLIQQIFAEDDFNMSDVVAIGASFTPRKESGSYMPCFTVGSGVARILSYSNRLPLYDFSHQQGHIAAALYSIDRLDLLNKPFVAFHVSGGTTEALLVNSNGSADCTNPDTVLSSLIVGRTLDLNAGQLVDRVGHMLGLSFPGGKQLQELALYCTDDIKAKPTIKGNDCCLSGVQNICQRLYDDGADKSYIAAVCLKHIEQSLFYMANNIIDEYGSMPIVFAGGVMSNSIIRDYMTKHLDCMFAQPEFSTDNACGIAVLASIVHNKSDIHD